ncbi:hypothetical protein AC249_AIPGENE16378 [Exaiptasia diaphana]|nr:hypothetical protein AC249_AIPGENE16378 [Exaiptasia diaphana]
MCIRCPDPKFSTFIQCDPAEVVEEDQEILLCWKFEIQEDIVIRHIKPENPDWEELDCAPRLNLASVVCNCLRLPECGYIILHNSASTEINDNQASQSPNDVYEHAECSTGDDDDEEEDWEDEEDEEDVTHILPFKCIGAAHERERQEHLEKAEEKMAKGERVHVKLRHEAENIYDRDALAIDMDYGLGWSNVGYIASELTKYIHPLLASDRIVSVSVQHIKFRVYFLKMGFYPKILITRKGAWENFVVARSKGVN